MENVISVLLDLEGTSDKITEETAEIFVRQIDTIRKIFNADKGIICISTHCSGYEKINDVLDILAKKLNNNIEIGLSFYYGGMYDYNNKTDNLCGFGFNSNKIATFEEFCLSNADLNNLWFSIIDDRVDYEVYKRYQKEQPMVIISPSIHESDLKYNNFMRIGTTTKNFDGVIEALNKYINSIEGLSIEEILEKQLNMISHLSAFRLSQKLCDEKDFQFIERYFSEGFADDDDYINILFYIKCFLIDKQLENEELEILKNIIALLKEYFIKNNLEEKNLEIEEIKRTLKL